MVVAVVVLLVAARHAGDVTSSERALVDLVDTLPRHLSPLFRDFYRVGALWAVGLVVVAAFVAHRWRLARDLVIAGLLARGVGRALGEIVVAHESFARSVRLGASFGGSPTFPTVRVGVTVAVISAAGPYVSRPVRVLGRLLVAAVALASLYLGAAYPNDLLAALVLGWSIAALVHLLFGSPGGRPTTAQVTRSLQQLGIRAHDVRLARRQPTGSTLMRAADDDGPLRVTVSGRDDADAQFLAKLGRFLLYKDPGPPVALSRLQTLKHEAYVMLAARDAGARVPRVVVAGSAGPGAALLVQRPVRGTRLAASDVGAVGDDVLAEIWRQVATLHRARLVHGCLDGEHIILGEDGPWLVGFEAAQESGAEPAVAHDIAQVLVATSSVVGAERAVSAAIDAVGPVQVAHAIPFLQPAALTRGARRSARVPSFGTSDQLRSLRTLAARTAGVDVPEPIQLHRISARGVALTVGTLTAVGVLLADVGDPSLVWNSIRDARWWWLAVAMALSMASNVGFAIGLEGTVPQSLPLWPTTELQVAMSFSNLAVPGIGGIAMQVRFLQRLGIDLSSAVAAGGLLSTVGNLVAALGLFLLALVIQPAHVDLSLLPASGLLELTLAVLALIGVLSGVVLAVPRWRRSVTQPLRRAASTMSSALRSPRHVALLLGGNALATLLSTATLAACIVAFHGQVAFWPLLAANIGVVTIASIVPIPGGGTAVGTVGLAAVLVSLGLAREVAVAAVLANQLVYYYLPAIPGWFATRHLLAHHYL